MTFVVLFHPSAICVRSWQVNFNDALIYGLFLLAFGLPFLIWGLLNIVKSNRWPVAKGIITNSRIEVETSTEDNYTHYLVYTSFTYKFDNFTYFSHGEECVQDTIHFDKAMEKKSEYPIGGEIILTCNP